MDRPGNKKGPRTPLIIQQQKYHQSRMSTESSEIGIVGSPTDKSECTLYSLCVEREGGGREGGREKGR